MRLGGEHEVGKGRNSVHDNFSSIMEESWFDKFKPALKVIAMITILVGFSYGAYAWSTQDKGVQSGKDSHTPISTSDNSSGSDKVQEVTPNQNSTPTVRESPTTAAQDPSVTTGNNSATPSQTSSYDPHKCDPLNDEASSLRAIAEQKKATYDSAFAARQDYGYFYDKYGNQPDAYLAYKTQQAQLDKLQTEWSDALAAGNAAYAKYQSCQSANLTQ